MVIRALVYVLKGFCYWRFGVLIPVGFAVDKGRKREHLRKPYFADFQQKKVKRKVQMGIAQFKIKLYLCSVKTKWHQRVPVRAAEAAVRGEGGYAAVRCLPSISNPAKQPRAQATLSSICNDSTAPNSYESPPTGGTRGALNKLPPNSNKSTPTGGTREATINSTLKSKLHVRNQQISSNYGC